MSCRQAAGLVPDRQPAPVRGGDARAGRAPVAADPAHAHRLRGDQRGDRVAAGAHRLGRDPRPAARGERRPVVCRRDRVDAHVLAGQDVDHRAGRAAETVAAPAHPAQRGAAVGVHRHGLHEPQPGRARRPRVRLHPDPARGGAQDRRRARERPGARPADRRVGAGRDRARAPADAAARPVRRQHARRRRDRGRQGGGGAAVRRLGQHLRRQRARDGRRRGRRRRGRPAGRRLRRRLPPRARARRAAATGTSRCGTPRASRPACAGSSPTAGSARSPRTSRTSAGCGSCRGSPCSG